MVSIPGFFHLAECIRGSFILWCVSVTTSFFFTTEWYGILFVLSSADGHWGSFYFLAIVSNAAVNIHIHVFVWTSDTFNWTILCCGCCPVHCRMFGGFPGFHPPDASSTETPRLWQPNISPLFPGWLHHPGQELLHQNCPLAVPKACSQVEIPRDSLREITFCGQPSLGRHTVHLPCFCPWKFMGYFSIFKVPRVSPTAATNYGTLCNSTFVKLTWPKNPFLIFTEHPWQQLWATLLRHLLPSDHTGLLTASLNTLCTFRPQKLCSYHVSSVAGTVPNSHSPPTCSLEEPQFCLGGNVSNLRGQIMISQSQMCQSYFSLPTTGIGVDTWPVLAREL